MQHDHEERILRNPALTARAFWHLARCHGQYSGGRAPELPQFLLGAAMIFHEATVERTHRMRFDTGLEMAVAECPDMLFGLQRRLDDNALPALEGLQVGCAAGLLMRVEGGRFPGFAAAGTQLPLSLRDAAMPVAKLFACARRLGAWYAAEDPLRLTARWVHIEL
ncbi:MAG: three component ABC system middle component [Hyphomicrobiaceae bacterium]|nr:three component ABC system middle component [Hyphomicrobiaceae bacterium]